MPDSRVHNTFCFRAKVKTIYYTPLNRRFHALIPRNKRRQEKV